MLTVTVTVADTTKVPVRVTVTVTVKDIVPLSCFIDYVYRNGNGCGHY